MVECLADAQPLEIGVKPGRGIRNEHQARTFATSQQQIQHIGIDLARRAGPQPHRFPRVCNRIPELQPFSDL